MAENPKFIELLKQVREASLKNSYDWNADYDNESFSVYLGPRATLTVGRKVGYGPESYYAILEDGSGKVLERLWQSDCEDPQETVADPWFDSLRGLYELARRKALKVDDLLDNLIESVKVKVKGQSTGRT